MHPSACPNSWTTTRRYSVAAVLSSSHPKFIVGSSSGKYFLTRQSIPTADHEPGSALNEIRTSDFGSFPKETWMFAYFSQLFACACTLAFCVGEPSRKRQRSFFLFGHFFAEISA